MIGLHIPVAGDAREECIKYTCDVLLSPLGLKSSLLREKPLDRKITPLVIHYGELSVSETWLNYVSAGGIIIAILDSYASAIKSQSRSSPRDEGNPKDLFTENYGRYYVNGNGKRVPFYFGNMSLRDDSGSHLYFLEDGVTPVASMKKEGEGVFIKLSIDIIRSTSFLLFEKHELIKEEKDDAKFSCNEYALLLRELIAQGCQELGIPLIRICAWPSNKPFAVCLCHDVDWISNWRLRLFEIKKQIFRSMQLGRERKFRKAIADFLNELLFRPNRADMRSSIKDVIKFERSLGFNSTFFFFGNTRTRNFFSGDRSYVTAREASFLEHLSDLSVEIGLHGSYASYIDGPMLAAEKKTLESSGIPARGIRQHCQRFDAGETWKAQEFAGFEYDATRMDCAFCFPFEVFHSKKNPEKNRIVEIPLSLMDESMTRYPNPSILIDKRREFLEDVKNLTDAVNAYSGVLSLLWHPFEKYQGCLSGYHDILRYINTFSPYVTTCSGLLDWWQRRSSVLVHCQRQDNGAFAVKMCATADISNLCFAIGNLQKTSRINGPLQPKLDNRPGDVFFEIAKLKKGEDVLIEIAV